MLLSLVMLHRVMYWDHSKLVAKCWRALSSSSDIFFLSNCNRFWPCDLIFTSYTFLPSWLSHKQPLVLFTFIQYVRALYHLITMLISVNKCRFKLVSFTCLFYFVTTDRGTDWINHIKEHVIAHRTWLQGITAHITVAVRITPVCGKCVGPGDSWQLRSSGLI